MSDILKQIYKDLIKKSNYCEDIEMTYISWSKLNKEQKKTHILEYMKNNDIQGNISEYTFKNIAYNKEQQKITKLDYSKKTSTEI